MNSNKNLSRRDFMKMGGLAAISLPTLTTVGRIGDTDIIESPETYGGFLIRRHAKDEAPYDVDDSVYQRFDARNVAFSRLTNDQEYLTEIMQIARQPSQIWPEEMPGFTRVDYALGNAAWATAGSLGTFQGTGGGRHQGLYQIEPLEPFLDFGDPNLYSEPWDHSRLTDEDVANIVKKAAKLYGASLVGITELDERWIYSHYSNMFDPDDWGEISLSDVVQVDLPEGMVTMKEASQLLEAEFNKMSDDELKAFIINMLGIIPPEKLPAFVKPAVIKAMPASRFPDLVPMLMGTSDHEDLTAVGKELGLDIVVSPIDPNIEANRPKYLEDGDTLSIPKSMKYVIVMAFEMDDDAISTSHGGPSAAAVGNGYSRMAATSSSLAEFIRALGYNAIPCGNNTGLSVPLAIDAGLGELGRQGVLITPKYGPRVRLAKVITDLPMASDMPISFGVTEFCEICGKCADTCPAGAISHGERVRVGYDKSNNPGTLKWPIKATECLKYWQTWGMLDCSNCIRSCPFTKPEGWLHEATRILIGARSGALDSILLKLDESSGFGTQADPEEFWESDNYVHIKS